MSDNNGYRVNGFIIRDIEDVDRLIAEVDATSVKMWGRPLNPAAIELLLNRCKKHVKTESARDQIDDRITELNKKHDATQFPIKTESQKHLEAAQKKRDAKLRAEGFEIEDDNDNEEPSEELVRAWRKREKENEERNRK